MHTTESLCNALKQALAYARRLPADAPSPWPGILWFGHEGVGQDVPSTPPLTAVEMEEYAIISSWMNFLKEEGYRRLLWAFVAGVPHWKIAEVVGPPVTPTAVARRIMWATGFIAFKLDDGQTPPAVTPPAVTPLASAATSLELQGQADE